VLRVGQPEGTFEVGEGTGVIGLVKVRLAHQIVGEAFAGRVGGLTRISGGLFREGDGARVIAGGDGGLRRFEQHLDEQRPRTGCAKLGQDRFVCLQGFWRDALGAQPPRRFHACQEAAGLRGKCRGQRENPWHQRRPRHCFQFSHAATRWRAVSGLLQSW